MAKNCYITVCLLLYCLCPCAAQPLNTGGRATRTKVAATYTAQIGVRELTGHNDGKAVEAYLRYCGLPKGNAWCAAFVCWSYGQSKVVNPRSAACTDLFKSKYVIWRRSSKANITPKTADIFGLYFPEKGRIAHTGFIDRWTATAAYTVEGNTNQAGSREGDGVYRKIRLTRQIYAVASYIKD